MASLNVFDPLATLYVIEVYKGEADADDPVSLLGLTGVVTSPAEVVANLQQVERLVTTTLAAAADDDIDSPSDVSLDFSSELWPTEQAVVHKFVRRVFYGADVADELPTMLSRVHNRKANIGVTVVSNQGHRYAFCIRLFQPNVTPWTVEFDGTYERTGNPEYDMERRTSGRMTLDDLSVFLATAEMVRALGGLSS